MQDWIRPLLGRHAAYRWQEYYQFYVMGGIILLAGIMIFVRFLRNNPKMELEELDG
ncbi:MAG: hypothetical protein HN929_03810 [Chloroflexi bacterium]|nr:hypothetical protein [Chloroflexota bacterium]